MTDKTSYYENEYLPKMNRIGKITGYLGVVVSFLPAIVLAVGYGLLPRPAALLSACIACAGSFAVLWVVEPISYFPILGPVCTYMTFLAGNLSNMRAPCASMAQEAAQVKAGTQQGYIISTIGVSVSIIINTSVLTIGVLIGGAILAQVPQEITASLQYLLPALFGALLVQFSLQHKSMSAKIILFSVLLNIAIRGGIFAWLPGGGSYLGSVGSVLFAFVVAVFTYNKQKEREAR